MLPRRLAEDVLERAGRVSLGGALASDRTLSSSHPQREKERERDLTGETESERVGRGRRFEERVSESCVKEEKEKRARKQQRECVR